MPDHIDELIGEIAKAHHISLGRDDPILMLHLVNERLLRESSKAQQVQLDRFKAELEDAMVRWAADIKEKSERILNLAIGASAALMEKNAQASTKSMNENLTTQINQYSYLIHRFLEQLRRMTIFSIGAACIVTLIGFLILVTP